MGSKRQLCWAVWLLIGFLVFGASAALASKRVALVIGNSRYDAAPTLPNPGNDASSFAEFLRRSGFDSVELKLDLDLAGFRTALRDFAFKAEESDTAVFYYAGHGLEVGGSNLLIPTDARLRTDLDAEDETVTVDRVLRALEPAKKLRLVFLDACRDNPFASHMKRLNTSRGGFSRGFQRIESAPADTMIAFATEPGSLAADGDGSNSPFTKALIDDVGTPGLDIRIALGKVRDDVIAATDGHQRPYVTGSLGGINQPLIPAGTISNVAPAQTIPSPLQGTADPEFTFAQQLNSSEGWKTFLRLHGTGELADKAREKLALLTPPKSDEQEVIANPVPNPPVPRFANGVIKIGVAGPITGPNASFGAQMQNGTSRAVDDINSRGGVLGRRLSLEIGDDVSDPRQGVAVANKFVADGVTWVLGHFNSGVTIPASDVYLENDILMITPSATNPSLTERGKWDVFRTAGRDDEQGGIAAKYIESHFKGKRIAVVHDKTTYGKGLADATKSALNRDGVKEVLYEGVNAGERDYSAIVSKIRASGADIVYWGGLHPEAGLIVRQMRDQGVNATMMSGDGITDNEFAAIGGPGVIGTLMTFGPDPRKFPSAAAVVREFKAENYDPINYTLYSYAAVQIMAEAAEHVRSPDPRKMAEYMHSGAMFHTVLGDLSYDKKGDLKQPAYVMYTWKRGPNNQITYFQND